MVSASTLEIGKVHWTYNVGLCRESRPIEAPPLRVVRTTDPETLASSCENVPSSALVDENPEPLTKLDVPWLSGFANGARSWRH